MQPAEKTEVFRIDREALEPRLRARERSATLAINERSARMQSQGRDVVRLGLGQSPFPVPRPVTEALRRNAHQKAYLPVQGLPELREAVADQLRQSQGVAADAARVLIGPGTKELMFQLQFAFEAELLIPAPSWVSYAPQAQIIGRDVHWLPAQLDSGLGVTAELLEAHCRKHPRRARLLILNYPCNPTGGTYSPAQLEAIAGVARRFGVLVLSDEIYSGLDFEGSHVSIARFYPEGSIVSNGLSKWCGAGGWRVGAFAFPAELGWLLDAMTVLASETFTSVAAPVQYAAVTAYRGGDEIDDYLDRSRRVLKALLGRTAKLLRGAGAALCEPRGGFYAFPRFDDSCPRFARAGRPQTSAELCRAILEDTGIALLPGSDFGRSASELFARIAAVDFDGEAALRGIAALPAGSVPDAEFLSVHCQPTLRGVERLCDWLGDR